MQNLASTNILCLLIICFLCSLPLSYSNLEYSYPPPVEKRKNRKTQKKARPKPIKRKRSLYLEEKYTKNLEKNTQISDFPYHGILSRIVVITALITGAILAFSGFIIIGLALIGFAYLATLIFLLFPRIIFNQNGAMYLDLGLFTPISAVIGLIFLIYGLVVALPLFWIVGIGLFLTTLLFFFLLIRVIRRNSP